MVHSKLALSGAAFLDIPPKFSERSKKLCTRLASIPWGRWFWTNCSFDSPG